MALKLKFMTGSNPRLEPLRDGTVKPDGIDLEFTEAPEGSFGLFQYNLHNDNFEVSEMSMSESLISRERRHTFGNGRWDWAYIPVFLGRGLNWDRISVLPDSDIKTAADLRGRRLAVNEYGMTSILWFRAMLKDLYDIDAGDIQWFNLRDRGKETGLDKDPPKGVDITWLPTDADPMAMLKEGKYDAVHGLSNNVAKSDQVRSLFPAGPKDLTMAHYRKNRSEHANHHYVIQGRILRENPWVAMSLYNAFEESRRIAIERAGKNSPTYLYFDNATPEEQAAVFGDDPFPSGIAANRPTIERLLQASYEQGLIRTPVTVEEFYPAEVQNT